MHTNSKNQNGGNDVEEKIVGADGPNTCASGDKLSFNISIELKEYKDFCEKIDNIPLDKSGQGIIKRKALVAEEILKSLKILNPDNSVIETRILDKNGNMIMTGWYVDMPKMAKDLAHEDHNYTIAAIYLTLNPVNPALLGRSLNKLRGTKGISTTKDADILRRRWLPVDLDPIRPSGISSTDEEFNYAVQKAQEIVEYLSSLGWSEPIVGVSSNGIGALYPIDLPADDNTVERAIKVFCKKFNTKDVEVDESVHNPSRIWKVYGTVARKGDEVHGIPNVPDRPHRRSKIIYVPEKLEIVTKEQLEDIIKRINSEIPPGTDEAEKENKNNEASSTGKKCANYDDNKREIVKRILEGLKKDGIEWVEQDKGDSITWDLKRCPMHKDHHTGAFFKINSNGKFGAGCQHKGCKGKNLWGWDELRAKYDPEFAKRLKCEENHEESEVSEEIKQRAREILERGDPIIFIVGSCSKMVLGADIAFKKLICCVSVQNIKQSAGLHPKLNGDSGGGKTVIVFTLAHHLPREAVVMGSTSNLAVFYHKSGDRILRILDDYKEGGNETLDTIIKQTTSVYHQRYPHKTTIKQKPVTLYIGSEQTWAITSVNGSLDIQVLNRQLPINVNESEELTKLINARIVERYGKGEEQYSEDDDVLVCREIWRILRSEGVINVRIPFHEQIEWLDNSNRRNAAIFLDLVLAHTAMYRYQRERDEEGFYLATKEDYEAAKALFNDKDAEELVKRLTRKEREFADLLRENPDGLTREDVAEKLNISPQRVSQLAMGEKGKGGLIQKLSGFHVEDISDMKSLGEGARRMTKKILYRLTYYDPLSGFDAVVKLKGQI